MRWVVLAVVLVGACGEPPAKAPAKTSGEVPANSLNDEALHPKKEDAAPKDPTQPLTTKVGETPLDPDALAGGSASSTSGGTSPSAPPTKPSGKPGKPEPPAKAGAVSKAECDRTMDKYLQLEMASNPQLKDLPPEILQQVKEQAREKHGEAPCTATRAQYNCAMAASSTAGWQKCMK